MINFTRNVTPKICGFHKAGDKFHSKEKLKVQAPRTKAAIKGPLEKDTFIIVSPNSNFKEISPIKTNKVIAPNNEYFTEEKIREIFDRTYEKMTEINPIMSKLNIEKPELIYEPAENQGDNSASAHYNIGSNKITLLENMNKDYYFSAFRLPELEIDVPVGKMNRSDLAELSKNFGCQNVETVKMTTKEKELFLECAFAHEIRHCIQSHLVASTKNVKDEYIQYMINLAKEVGAEAYENNPKDYERLAKLHRKLGYQTTGLIEAEIGALQENYILSSYKPNKLFEPEETLKYSLSIEDTKEWSIKEHLLPSITNVASPDELEYKGSPIEIDANRLQLDYIFKFFTHNKDIRSELIDLMAKYHLFCSDVAFATMEEVGYPPIISKDNQQNQ